MLVIASNRNNNAAFVVIGYIVNATLLLKRYKHVPVLYMETTD